MNSQRKREALLLVPHVLPFAPTVGVHAGVAWASPEKNGGITTELKTFDGFSSLSPAVRVLPFEIGIAAGLVVHASTGQPTADVGFWDGATVSPVSGPSGLPSATPPKMTSRAGGAEATPTAEAVLARIQITR